MRQNQLKNSSKFDIFVQEMELNENEYPHLKMFRLTRECSYNNMVAAFLNHPSYENDFKLIKICIQNIDGIHKLQKMYPIIELTSALLQKYNH